MTTFAALQFFFQLFGVKKDDSKVKFKESSCSFFFCLEAKSSSRSHKILSYSRKEKDLMDIPTTSPPG